LSRGSWIAFKRLGKKFSLPFTQRAAFLLKRAAILRDRPYNSIPDE